MFTMNKLSLSCLALFLACTSINNIFNANALPALPNSDPRNMDTASKPNDPVVRAWNTDTDTDSDFDDHSDPVSVDEAEEKGRALSPTFFPEGNMDTNKETNTDVSVKEGCSANGEACYATVSECCPGAGE
eukprot:Pgem_evm1s7030